MHKLTKLLGALSLATIFYGCELLSILAETATPPVEIKYNWWNNLINTPVIEGTIQNNTSYRIWKTTIEVQTFDSNGECIFSDCISVCEDIEPGQCATFKEWISASPQACNLKARVASYD